ncbi:hypothetical protein K438DRAFT_363642 [Mycena galopus ATCC 62051]|nr:hypothetical protein K438DRAFT_363642 [Mycena galopus ATCC 62051]
MRLGIGSYTTFNRLLSDVGRSESHLDFWCSLLFIELSRLVQYLKSYRTQRHAHRRRHTTAREDHLSSCAEIQRGKKFSFRWSSFCDTVDSVFLGGVDEHRPRCLRTVDRVHCHATSALDASSLCPLNQIYFRCISLL